MSIGNRVRTLRKALGLSQPKLAALVGIKQPSLSYIENNPSNEIKQETLLALAKHLHTNPQWLSTGKGSPSKSEIPSIDQSEVLQLFNALSDVNKNSWLSIGRLLLESESDKPKALSPFKKSTA
jgi:transcriptional regulator with XRE-family HTH domain